MLNFVLCDDNASVLGKLSQILESIFIQNGYNAQIAFQCTNPNELLFYLSKHTPDVIFLDINFHSEISGLTLAQQIRKYNKKSYIIFVTGHLEYSPIAYQYGTFDYISKPFTYDRIEASIKRLWEDFEIRPSFIRMGTGSHFINADQVEYIQRDGMKLIYQSFNNNYESYSSFKKIEGTLPANFVRSHKSYIVNINHISHIEPNHNLIYFANGSNCSIGPKYKNTLMEVIKNHELCTNDKIFSKF